MRRHSGVFIGLMVLFVMILAACGQPDAPVAPEVEPADATPETVEVADDQIRVPQGDIEEFWNSFAWADLTTAEQEAWGALGWDAISWDEETNIPASEEATWAELTPEEQAAAQQLGYTQETWDATAPAE